MHIRIDNRSYGLSIRMGHTDCQSICACHFFRVLFLLYQQKPIKIHRILLSNARTLPEIKYALKLTITEITYTKWRRFCEKKNGTTKIKLLLLFITKNNIRHLWKWLVASSNSLNGKVVTCVNNFWTWLLGNICFIFV